MSTRFFVIVALAIVACPFAVERGASAAPIFGAAKPFDGNGCGPSGSLAPAVNCDFVVNVPFFGDLSAGSQPPEQPVVAAKALQRNPSSTQSEFDPLATRAAAKGVDHQAAMQPPAINPFSAKDSAPQELLLKESSAFAKKPEGGPPGQDGQDAPGNGPPPQAAGSPPPFGNVVPEPSVIMLMLLAAPAVLKYRRRNG